MAEINRNYKDSVFRMLFSEKDKLIELYNAIFDTEYTDDESVDITTLEDVVFKTMKNDISFVLGGRAVLLVEHQSSINNNEIGELSQKLYDELYGIQTGEKADTRGWTVPVE